MQVINTTIELQNKVRRSKTKMDDPFARRKMFNVFFLGLVFMTVASRTPITIMKTVMYSARNENGTGYVDGFTGDGYVSNAVLYATFAVSNFLAPWLISLVGPR